MLVPTPRKIKERRKNAASTMATSFIQKLILSRFIIMAGYPPRFSGTETIVYHVAADYGNRDSPPGSGLEDLPLGISTVERRLYYCEIGPFPRLQRPRLGLDTERARPPERRQLETSHATHTMHLHREQRLLEKVHARTAPEPVSTHTDPDAGGDHAKHGRDAAPEEVIRTGTMRRRYAGLDQNPYVLFGDSGRQVRGYRLGGEQLHVLSIAHGRYSHSSPLFTNSTSSGLSERWIASVHPISRVLCAARCEDSGSTVYGECTLTLAFTRSGRPSPSSRAFAIMNSTASSGVPISCGKNSA